MEADACAVHPQSIVDRVVARRGREHVHDALDPARTALVVVDMQNAFMLPGVAHALCPMAEKIVPNINRLAQAVRTTGGTVIWIKTTFKDDALKNWSTYFEMVKPEQGARRVAALTAGSKGHELWAALDVRADDLIVEKNRFSAFIQGRQILPKSCASVASIPFSSRARSPTCAASRRRATP
jgi:ureidoacrylate peracid hydrolase